MAEKKKKQTGTIERSNPLKQMSSVPAFMGGILGKAARTVPNPVENIGNFRPVSNALTALRRDVGMTPAQVDTYMGKRKPLVINDMPAGDRGWEQNVPWGPDAAPAIPSPIARANQDRVMREAMRRSADARGLLQMSNNPAYQPPAPAVAPVAPVLQPQARPSRSTKDVGKEIVQAIDTQKAQQAIGQLIQRQNASFLPFGDPSAQIGAKSSDTRQQSLNDLGALMTGNRINEANKAYNADLSRGMESPMALEVNRLRDKIRRGAGTNTDIARIESLQQQFKEDRATSALAKEKQLDREYGLKGKKMDVKEKQLDREQLSRQFQEKMKISKAEADRLADQQIYKNRLMGAEANKFDAMAKNAPTGQERLRTALLQSLLKNAMFDTSQINSILAQYGLPAIPELDAQ